MFTYMKQFKITATPFLLGTWSIYWINGTGLNFSISASIIIIIIIMFLLVCTRQVKLF